jgi:hypothetical protein
LSSRFRACAERAWRSTSFTLIAKGAEQAHIGGYGANSNARLIGFNPHWYMSPMGE